VHASLRGSPRTRTLIVFAEPLPAPLALRAGRHVGLGIFADPEAHLSGDATVLDVLQTLGTAAARP
jgi:hypothetical protein